MQALPRPNRLGPDSAGFIYTTWSWYVQKVSPAGELIWEKTLQQGNRLGGSYSSIVVDGRGNLFFGMGKGLRWAIEMEKNLYLWDTNGTTVSSFALPEPTCSSSPAIGPDGTLYIGCLDGRLYAFR